MDAGPSRLASSEWYCVRLYEYDFVGIGTVMGEIIRSVHSNCQSYYTLHCNKKVNPH